MGTADLFMWRMFRRARLEDAVVRAAEDLVDQWESTDPFGNFGGTEDALIEAVHNYRAVKR